MNIYELRKQKKLYFVLPEQYKIASNNDCIETKKIAVFVNLYYEEDFDFYNTYLLNVPSFVDVYIVSSKDCFEQFAKQNGYKFVSKQNRGRDISALLVALKPYIAQYDYFCFVHDKKSLYMNSASRVKPWIESMWNNLLNSSYFIENIITTLNNNQNIGLLVPPEPMFNNWYSFGTALWSKEFEQTKALAKKLNIVADISFEYEPITIGTVFWCRYDALKKLLSYNWTYEDFVPEPMPSVCTISHAIERIIGYVAQDAGFDVGTVVADSYALDDYINLRSNYRDIMDFFTKAYHMGSFLEIQHLITKYKTITNFINSRIPSYIYIYGAGVVAKRCFEYLKTINYMPKGFIVTQKDCETAYELPVWNLDEAPIDKNSLIIVAVSNKYKEEISATLNAHGVNEENIMYFS